MNRPGISRTLFLSLMLMTLGFLTQSAFAAGRGGGGGGGFHGGGGGGFHGGGGGFHGGGGYGGGFHGASGGGWHGGGYSGYRGGYGYGGWRGGYGYGGWRGGYGYGGWRGGYGYGGWRGGWGCCGWGWGWGFGVSLNFGWPYGGYYGYPYSYYPYPYASYPYPYSYYYAPVSNSTYDSPVNNSTAADYSSAPYSQAGGYVQNSAPPAQFSASVPRPPTLSNSVAVQDAIYRPGASSYSTALATQGGVVRRPVSAQGELPATRPEVQNVIRALRSMPPGARQRQIDSGRYSNLSPQELQLVRSAADVPL